jgi:hypothetical protein
MADVDWDVASLTRSYLDNNWDDAGNGISKPDRVELLTEDNTGKARQKVRRNSSEYILVYEPGERNIESADIFHESEDKSAMVAIEASTQDGRARREEIFKEIKRLTNERRKRSGPVATPGNWDKLNIQTVNPFDDTAFGWHVLEMTVEYSRHSDLI